MRICRLSVIALALVGLLVVPAAAQLHLEYVGTGPRDPIPPDGSQWHGIAPIFCDMYEQVGYEDNGDGDVSICDVIILVPDVGGEPKRYHIDWAGPTYHLVATGFPETPPYNDGAAEPEDPGPYEDDPTGDMWHWIYPPEVFCTVEPVEGWEDGGTSGEPNGILDACDNVFIGGFWWHIEAVELNIEVTEEPSPVEPTTWSKVKSFFKQIF